MSVAELDPQILAEQKQKRELMELAERFEKLADRMIKIAVDEGLTIKQCNIFFGQSINIFWTGKVEKFLGSQKTKNLL